MLEGHQECAHVSAGGSCALNSLLLATTSVDCDKQRPHFKQVTSCVFMTVFCKVKAIFLKCQQSLIAFCRQDVELQLCFL